MHHIFKAANTYSAPNIWGIWSACFGSETTRAHIFKSTFFSHRISMSYTSCNIFDVCFESSNWSEDI
jgi:hypothetical protein